MNWGKHAACLVTALGWDGREERKVLPLTTAVRTIFCFGAREQKAIRRGVTSSDAKCMCIRPAAVGDL